MLVSYVIIIRYYLPLFFSEFRRKHLRDCLHALRDLVPTSPDSSKVTTLNLLQSAKQYIKVRDDFPSFILSVIFPWYITRVIIIGLDYVACVLMCCRRPSRSVFLYWIAIFFSFVFIQIIKRCRKKISCVTEFAHVSTHFIVIYHHVWWSTFFFSLYIFCLHF